MDPEPPRADPASEWMKHLERAHQLAHTAARAIEDYPEPWAHLAPAARRLESGLGAMYDAFDGRADRVTAIGVAGARLWDAAVLVARAGLPSAVEALRIACAELIAAEERFPRVALAPRAPAELVAAIDLPRQHAIERSSLVPSLRAPPEPVVQEEPPAVALPEPTTFEELAAAAKAARSLAKVPVPKAPEPREIAKHLPTPVEIPRGFALPPPKPIGEDAFVQRWARECFEEIGMLGLQRTPLAGDDWRSCQPLDTRLILAVDALAALGPVAVAYVEPLAKDAPAVDPMRVFAAAMIGGCLEGRDALACAERVAYRFGPADPLVAEPFAGALKLAPSPFVRSVADALFRSPEHGCRAIAVDVLTHRGWLDDVQLAELCDEEDPRVLALALPALAAARHRDLDRVLERALAHADARVQAAALDAMAIAAHPRAASAARDAVEGPLGERALIRVAIAADEDDARWLLDRLESSPSALAVEAVGWAGLLESVPSLLRLLGDEDEAIGLAAGAALDRLLGANLIDTIEVLPEALESVDVVDPDPAPPPARGAALAEMMSNPRDKPPEGSSETLEVPSKDPDKWRAYWAEHGRKLDPKQRLRRGQGYSPSVSLYELDRLPLPPEDRRRLHRELALRTGKITHFDPFDFVVAQEASLKAWESLVRARVEAPGSWGRPVGR